MLKRKVAPSAALIAAPLAGLLCQPLMAATAGDADSAAASSDAGNSTTSVGNNALQEVTVLGQRTTSEIARAAQQQAINLINLTTADEMLKLPDVTAELACGAGVAGLESEPRRFRRLRIGRRE